MSTRRALLACAAAMLASACQTSTGPEGKRVVGIVEWDRNSTRAEGAFFAESAPVVDLRLDPLVAPDTVQSGVPFTAIVSTFGPSTCWWEAGAEMSLEPAAATITPYDRTLETEDGDCPDSYRFLRREVELRFEHPGVAVLRVTGRKVLGSNFDRSTPTTVEKRIYVK